MAPSSKPSALPLLYTSAELLTRITKERRLPGSGGEGNRETWVHSRPKRRRGSATRITAEHQEAAAVRGSGTAWEDWEGRPVCSSFCLVCISESS